MTRYEQVRLWLSATMKTGGRWRQLARVAMRREVESYLNVNAEVNGPELLKRIDAAYPFDSRELYPYKAWLAERRIIKDILIGKSLTPPTDEDAAACDVARDLVELGRIDEAKALLEEQAPRRLNVACPACGVIAGKQCRDPYEKAEMPPDFMQRPWYLDGNDRWVIDRVVPHESRVRVVHGPLFGSTR